MIGLVELFLVRPREKLQLPTESVSWSGQRSQPARRLVADILYSDTSGLGVIEIEEGDTVVFRWKSEELFRGVIFSRTQTQRGTLKLTAYDVAQYLLLNQEVYTFTNQRADQILVRICRDFGIPIGTIANTGVSLTETHLTFTTLYDIVLQALENTEKTNNRRFQLRAKKGLITLIEWRENSRQWVLETGANVIAYNAHTTILENTATRVKLINTDDENTLTAIANHNSGQDRFGLIQHSERVGEDLNQAQLNERARAILNEKRGVERLLDVTALGIAECTSGAAIQVKIPDIKINGTRFINSDTHYFNGDSHQMDLSLTVRG